MSLTSRTLREESYHDRITEILNDKYIRVANGGNFNLIKFTIMYRKYPANVQSGETLNGAFLREVSLSDHEKLVKFFIRRVGNVNYQRGLLLVNAVYHDDFKLVEYLFSQGALLNVINITADLDPFTTSIMNNNFKMTKLLLEHSNNMTLYYESLTAEYLVSSNNLRLVKLVLEYNPRYPEQLVISLTNKVLNSDNSKLIKYVLKVLKQYGSDDILGTKLLNYFKSLKNDFTPDIEYVKKLVEYGTNLNTGNGSILKYLISQGKYDQLVNTNIPSKVIGSIYDLTYPLIDLFVSNGANLNMNVNILRDNFYHEITPLTIAVWSRSPRLVAQLLKSGADPNLYYSIAIREAIRAVYDNKDVDSVHEDCLDIIKILIDYGADIKGNDKLYNQINDARLLNVVQNYKKGDIDVNLFYRSIERNDINTVLDIMRKSIIINYNTLKFLKIYNQEMIDILKSYLRSQDQALYNAVSGNNVKAVEKLLKSGMILDFKRLSHVTIVNKEILDLVNEYLRR
jgi:hypothetical protein